MGVPITFCTQIILTGINDEESDIQAAFIHFWQVHLSIEILGVVNFGGEIFGVDICVSVECDNPLVDASSNLHRVLTLRADSSFGGFTAAKEKDCC